MKLHFLPIARRNDWVARLAAEAAVFVPAVVKDAVHWHRLREEDLKAADSGPVWALDRIRAAEPVKSFFFSPRERVASFPEATEPAEPAKRVLFGAKSCDLLPLKVHEKMFLEGEYKDPFYEARLKNTVIIAADCPAPEDTCFCNLVGRKPYATEGADIVLSVVEGGYLLEALTETGEELIRLGGSAIQPANDAQASTRDEMRRAAEEKLSATNPKPWKSDLPAAIAAKAEDAGFWGKHAADCVECFGCLMACPTCYCFLLYDQAKADGAERTKVWDACYIAAFARVGGGANPRGEFLTRFKNRFQCKFQHFKNAHGFYSCSGCGRCYRVCMGKIDIREVLGAM